MKRATGIMTKVVSLFIAGMIVLTAVLVILSINTITGTARESVLEMASDKIHGDIRASEFYVQQYYGLLHVDGDLIVDHNGRALDGRFEVIDRISADLGILATIFVRDGGDYRRVVTSIRDGAGERDGIGVLLMSAIVLLLLVGVIAAILVVQVISRPVSGAASMATKLAHGDLTGETPAVYLGRRDKVGMLVSSFDTMKRALNEVVRGIQVATAEVSSGSGQISTVAQQLSQDTTEQAASAEEVSSSMEQMGSNIQQNADNAMQTDRIAQEAGGDAERGGRAVEETVTAMKEIASRITIIEEIARNTNLLSEAKRRPERYVSCRKAAFQLPRAQGRPGKQRPDATRSSDTAECVGFRRTLLDG